jgi:hypothetical protein
MKWVFLIIVALVLPIFFLAMWFRTRANRKANKTRDNLER